VFHRRVVYGAEGRVPLNSRCNQLDPSFFRGHDLWMSRPAKRDHDPGPYVPTGIMRVPRCRAGALALRAGCVAPCPPDLTKVTISPSGGDDQGGCPFQRGSITPPMPGSMFPERRWDLCTSPVGRALARQAPFCGGCLGRAGVACSRPRPARFALGGIGAGLWFRSGTA
jgi:hypothetical protein